MTSKIVDLDALCADQRVIVGGNEYPVKAASAKVVKLAASSTDETHLDVALQIVRTVCPTMPPDVVDALTVLQLETIMALSSEGIVTVQESDPNEARPATESSSPA